MSRNVLLVSWRSLVLGALMFWQGGFLFYISAVVPTAAAEITHSEQGFITRKVTIWINNAAIISLAMLAADAALFPDPRPWRRRTVWTTWLAMTLCQIALAVLHPYLDSFLDPETRHVARGFRNWHQAYLWIHTIQSVAAVTYLSILIAAWRTSDRVSTP